MKSLHGASSDKVIHVKSHMACPVKQKDGTWKVVLKDYEEDIPDLGREDLICNAVSYTHLDVYKRQVIFSFHFLV